jgi:hypothetical protein
MKESQSVTIGEYEYKVHTVIWNVPKIKPPKLKWSKKNRGHRISRSFKKQLKKKYLKKWYKKWYLNLFSTKNSTP